MKVRILKRFKDKHTGEIYASGEEVDFSEERVQEILESQKLIELMEELETEEPEAKSTEKQKGKKTEEEL
ncbi:MAG: hypothetical protein SOU16_10080 [Faecalimonas sp.]|nr:hypothetical protein [Faecalimonas sp.]